MSDSSGEAGLKFYQYTPSIAAAVIFIVLFTITTAYHLYQLARNKSWYFVAFVLGGIFQIIGYAARAAAHSNMGNVPIYSVQAILILLAPALYAASIYMVLGRIIHYLHAEHFSLVPVQWLTGIFVTGDVIAFVAQAAGGATMASSSLSARTTGEHITIGGLCVQLVFFTIFVLTSATFHRRIRLNPTQRALQLGGSSNQATFRSWESALWGLYIASALILIRSIFRLVEYAQGNDGYLIGHEAFMYVFDATLMVFAMVTMNVLHPSVILAGDYKHRQGSMESLRSVPQTQLENMG
ncbi:RTA1 domain-containing protein [Aspergillus novofumigatus IBT 16806]|uniref:RTA1 like protein n=1 Tax=Aspergillus novofumigatus (strain IBT 16806) TaxID=1392255 RepID=A0A2I1BU93_ASPN1|nr:RTA1 like protein [Aspergillus novofumigatus IBT 16806]PKX88936.1 RTA1 like protein [Aspergillus novofumigatus IBT 16806]